MTVLAEKTQKANRTRQGGRVAHAERPGTGHPNTVSGRAAGPVAAAIAAGKKKIQPARVREELGLKQPDFARMTGYSVRSVAGWEAGQPVSPSARQKLAEMDRLRQGLVGVMAAEHIGQWLTRPNDAFGGQTPLQVVERGEIDRLWRMIFQLEAGVAT